MVTKIVQEPTDKNIAEKIAERAERGYQLYLTSRQLITKLAPDLYEVPSCTTQEIYTVRYGADVEDCTCPDRGARLSDIACKHLTAVALLFASEARRSERERGRFS